MEMWDILSPRPGLLYILFCAVQQFTEVSPTAPCQWAIAHPGHELTVFNCTVHKQEIRLPGQSIQTLSLFLSSSSRSCFRRSDFLPHFPSMSKVNLSHIGILEIQEAAFIGFSHLEELDLSKNCLHILRDGILKGLGRLKTLDLRQNQISEVQRYAFADQDGMQILWLQNNNLDSIPEAIRGLANLQVLSLANNQISWVNSESFQGCRSLTALHLQHNRISGVAVDAFGDLMKLQMLNMGANLLETIPGPTLQSLWGQCMNIRLHGNPWRCNCSLAELRMLAPRWLTGRVRCYGGTWHGVPLSSLSPGQLGCHRTLRVSQTIAVNIMEGTDMRIPCRNGSLGGEAQYWQTPFGRLENCSTQDSWEPILTLEDGSIKISRASPYHTGLYYCLWAAREERVIQPYKVECRHSTLPGRPRPRKTREAEEFQETVSAAHFTAAVTSSVLVTFLVGFILGSFSRTYLSRCFSRFSRRPQPGSGGVRMGNQRWQYENETYRRGGRLEDESSSEAAPTETTPPGGGHATWPYANQGPTYLEGSDSGRLSQAEAPDHSMGSGGTMKPGNERDGSPEDDDASKEGATRPSKRRVIKLYNYDEEGIRYSHLRAAEDESEPRTRQRTLSLTRLSAIMASASEPSYSTGSGYGTELSPGDTVEQGTGARDGKPTFHLSI
ncbi:hypothetical protein GJAV_G00054670 [Gymnothorax javanicus]|nr:hypothetical protein GJAV_G00054670 [Gymnothorax javanicus]